MLILKAVADDHEPRVPLAQIGGELIMVMPQYREALDGAGLSASDDQHALASFGFPIAGAVQLEKWLTALVDSKVIGRLPPSHGKVEWSGSRRGKDRPHSRHENATPPRLRAEHLHVMNFKQEVLVQREYRVETGQEVFHREFNVIAELKLFGQKCFVEAGKYAAHRILKATVSCGSVR